MFIFKGILVAIDWINEKIGLVLSYILYFLFILILSEVIMRYVFNRPTIWQGELAQYLFAAYAILCGGFILRTGGHVNVDIIYSHFSEKTRAACDLITSVLFFFFTSMLALYGGFFAFESISYFETSQSPWDPPLWPVKCLIPIGALLLLLQGVVKFVQDLCIVLGKEPPVKPVSEEGENV
jgi:TRAP-type mannitol/chloroaromatic compound transport system permease small subunit